MYLIGLTGGIASGKSVVAKRLAEHGAIHVDADQLAREVVEPGTPALARIREEFGDGVIGPDGTLDRPALGAIIFFFAKDMAGDVTEHWQGIIGIILIVVMLVLPVGLGGALAKLWQRRAGHG